MLGTSMCVDDVGSAWPAEDCFNTTCCSVASCKRREHKQYAQCGYAQGCVLRKDGNALAGKLRKLWNVQNQSVAKILLLDALKAFSSLCTVQTHATSRHVHRQREWKCPGWELCSDTYQPCTNTHCCADSRDVCYQKRPFFSQCLRKGTCKAGVDGICEEQRSTLGLCSESFHDCHLTACCQAGEDHCFLKNEGYGKCMPSCDPCAEDPKCTC